MVAIAHAVLMIGLFAWLRTDISRQGERLDKRMDGLDKRIDDLRAEIKQDFGELRQEVKQDFGELRQEVKQDFGELRQEVKQDFGELRQEVKQDIAGLRSDMDKRLDDLDGRFRMVEHGLAKLEGLLEGLREAIAGRKDAA